MLTPRTAMFLALVTAPLLAAGCRHDGCHQCCCREVAPACGCGTPAGLAGAAGPTATAPAATTPTATAPIPTPAPTTPETIPAPTPAPGPAKLHAPTPQD
jgi:hypothetical protein